MNIWNCRGAMAIIDIALNAGLRTNISLGSTSSTSSCHIFKVYLLLGTIVVTLPAPHIGWQTQNVKPCLHFLPQ